MATRKSIVWGDIAKIQFKKINQYYYDNVGNTIFCEKLTKEVDHVLHLISEIILLESLYLKQNFDILLFIPMQ